MEAAVDLRTRLSQLAPLVDPGNSAAWHAFVNRYGPLIYAWARAQQGASGLQPDDLTDITQDVLLGLVRAFQDGRYDPAKGRFRDYLRAATRYAVWEFVDRRRRAGRTGGEDVQEMLAAVVAREDLGERLAQEYDRELLEIAIDRVAARVNPDTLKVWRKTAVDQLAAQDVAEESGMSLGAVYMAKSRVQAMITEEIARLVLDS
jgi:RNA polymerase sigma factor (sigma-70 family)